MTLRIWTLALAAALAAGVPVTAASANWLTSLTKHADEVGGAVRKADLPGGDLGRLVASLPADARKGAVIAEALPEGHWRLSNAAGETMTAADAKEIGDLLRVLLPEAAGGRPKFFLAPETVFERRTALADLPDGLSLHVVDRDRSYPLLIGGSGAEVRLHAEVRENLVVPLVSREAFDEVLWQLRKPLARSSVRVLALEPGGPRALTRTRTRPAEAATLVPEPIDPAAFADGLRGLSGETVIVTGVMDGDRLRFLPSSGSEQTIAAAELFKAASRHDVNLVLLHASGPAQPGTRNWLLQPATVAGLAEALRRTTQADFLAAVASGGGRLEITAAVGERGHVRILAKAAPSSTPAPSGEALPAGEGGGGFVENLVSNLAGDIVASAAELDVRSRQTQEELDIRIIPGVPTYVQYPYFVLLLLGLYGLPVVRRWWLRLFPPKPRSGYASSFGYGMARFGRFVGLALLFLPAVALLAAPVQLVSNTIDGARSILGWIAWPFRAMLARRQARP
jgi:hypothetical protein